jgi:hypothetical protein
MFRYHLLVSSSIEGALQLAISRAQTTIKDIEGVQWIVDMDALDMI